MKIMQINSFYNAGSTGKIVFDIHKCLLSNGQDSVVCYGRGSCTEEQNVYKTCSELSAKINRTYSRLTGLKYGGCFFSTHKLISIIKKEKPDIVHIHCINGYFVNIYRIISYLNNHNIKTVLTLHAEFMYTANCGYSLECDKWKTGCGNCPRLKQEIHSFFIDNTSLSWKKMKKAFDGFENLRVVSVSPWLQKRAQISPILKNKKHSTILNGIDTSIFKLNSNKELKSRLGLNNKKIVFHITSNFNDEKNHIKGGFYVLEIAKRFLETNPDVVFLVAGKYQEIKSLPSNVILLGNVEDQNKLSEYYSMADVTLLSSKKETFSMVVAESICCGTPVVGFEAGAPELITIPEFSDFVEQGDVDALTEALKKWLFDVEVDKAQVSDCGNKKYRKEIMGQNYLNLYNELMR